MKKTFTLFVLLALASILNAQQAGVTKSAAAATLDQITGNLTFGSGKTLTATTGATVNLGNATVTLPATVSGGTSSFQPLDADLTAIAALSTTATGRSLLAVSLLTNAGLGITNGAVLDTIGAKAQTGTGNLVLATSPTLVTPTIDTITASTSTALTLTGGSTGASLVLGQGTTAGNATITPTGSGNIVTTSSRNGALKHALTNANAGTAAYVAAELNNGSDVGVLYQFGTAWTTSGRFIQASTLLDSSATGGLTLAVSGGTPLRFWSGAELARFAPTTGNLLIGTTTDAANLSGGLVINGSGTASAASNTTTGALRVTGGVGVSGAGYFGGILNAAGTGTHTFGTTNTVTMAAGVLTVTSAASNGLIVRPANGNALAIFDASAGAADANAYFTLQTSGAPRWYFGQSISAASGDFEIYSVPLGASALKLAKTTGAATFAGAVTANGQLIAKGTATNDNAATGYIGEYVSSLVATGSAVALTASGTAYNVTSISLTAGDWDVETNASYNMTGTTGTLKFAGVSTTSATFGGPETYALKLNATTTTTNTDGLVSPLVRVSLSATTTVYMVARHDFSAGTVSAFGSIRARRVR